MNLSQMLLTQKNVDQIASQFGLSQQDAVRAMQAVIPAFSEGLQRQTSSAQGAASLIQALSSGHHAAYVEDPSQAVSAAGIGDGEKILGHLFGNKDVSRGVASHAAASTGIGSSLLKQMLPAIASMVMGSLFKGATSGRSGGALGKILGQAAGGGLLGTLIEGLAGGAVSGAKQSTRTRRTRSRRRKNGGVLSDILGQVLGGGASSTQTMPRSRRTTNSRRRQRRESPSGGLNDILGDLLGGRQTKPSRRRAKTRRTKTGGINDVFGDMLQPGGQTSREYQRQTKSVFDELLK